MHVGRSAVLVAGLLASCASSCSLVTTWDALTGHSADAGAPDSAPPDDAADDAAPAPPASCVEGSAHCGGHGVPGDAGALYRCTTDGGGSLVQPCEYGCISRNGQEDSCRPCHQGGYYCGDDKISPPADRNTLYRCNADGSGTAVATCPHGCVINAAADDACVPCQAGAFYCGGDNLIGDANTLYRCKSDGTGAVYQKCSGACIVHPGQDDSCG
jgi:hypothetical protein